MVVIFAVISSRREVAWCKAPGTQV